MKYVAPYGSTDPNAPYVNGDPSIGRAGSIPPAAAFEHPLREIQFAIDASGQAPSELDLTQLWKAIVRAKQGIYAEDIGTANDLTIEPVPSPTSFDAGAVYLVKVAEANTGATTLTVTDLGTRQIVRPSGDALRAGDLVPDGVAILVYDGAKFQLESTPASLLALNEASFWHYGADTGPGPNQVVIATPSPKITAYTVGLAIGFVAGSTNTGTTTINIAGLGNKELSRGSGNDLEAGDLLAGTMALAVYDGAQFQLLNALAAYGGGGGGGDPAELPAGWNSVIGPLRPYWLAVISATVTAPPGSPTVGDAYLIPTGATGAWSGLGNRIAQFTDAGWVTKDYPVASVVGIGDTGKYRRRTASGWETFFTPATRDFVAISSNTTAVAGGAYICDTSTAPFTLLLPASPAQQDMVRIADGANFKIKNLIIGRNGAATIHGIAQDLTVDVQCAGFSLIYVGTDWRIV
jgi:hypothetical protein